MKPLATAGRFVRFLGIDRAVGFTLVGHAWNILSGPILITLIVWRLSQSERAVLFNYVSIGDFQILFELGVGRVLQQFASREAAFLTPAADGTFTGDPAAKARLAALLRLTVRWLLGVVAVAAAVLLPGGWLFFTLSSGLEGVNWQAAWVLSVAVAGGQGLLNGLMLFMAGCGDVTPVARTTALQNMVMSLAPACFLAVGASLLSHPLSGMAGLAVALGWLLLSRRRRLADLWGTGAGPSTLSWRARSGPSSGASACRC